MSYKQYRLFVTKVTLKRKIENGYHLLQALFCLSLGCHIPLSVSWEPGKSLQRAAVHLDLPALCHAAVLLLTGWATLFAAGLALCFPACLCVTGRDFSEVCGVPGGIGHPKIRAIPGYITVIFGNAIKDI